MMWLDVFAILLAITVIAVGNFKKWNIIAVTISASFLYTVISRHVSLLSFIFDYWTGFSDFFIHFFPLYLAGALFSAVLEATGAIVSFIHEFSRCLGLQHILLFLGILSFFMVLSGFKPVFIVFMIYPILKKSSEILAFPPELIPACILGFITPAQMLPGSTQLQNLLPVTYINMSNFGAPLPGIFCSALTFFFVYLYLRFQLPSYSQKAFSDIISDSCAEKVSFIPMLMTVGGLFLCVNVLEVSASFSLFLCCGVLLLIYRPKTSLLSLIVLALTRTRTIFLTSSLAGFASVLQNSSGLSTLFTLITEKSWGNPLVFAFFIGSLFAGILGSSSSALVFTLNALQPFSQYGALAPYLGRFLSLGTLTFDTLPQSSVVALVISHCNTSYRKSYLPIFIVTALIPFLCGCITLAIFHFFCFA